HDAAHHAADKGGAGRVAGGSGCGRRGAAGGPSLLRRAASCVVGGTGRGRSGPRLGFAQQGLVLERVEIAAYGIPPRGLPPLDDSPGTIGERARLIGVKAKGGEATLDVATLSLVQSDLILGELGGLLREGCRVDAGDDGSRRGRRTMFERGDPR